MKRLTLIFAVVAATSLLQAEDYYCTGCNGPLLRSDTFCPKCGARVEFQKATNQGLDSSAGYGRESRLGGTGKGDVGGGVITPIQLSLFDGASLPGSSCSVYGMQLSLLTGSCKKLCGVGLGLFNTDEAMYGVQIGVVNLANTVGGIQLGLINRTEDMCGIQVGLINVIRNSDLQFLPILNMHF